jgi:hypothetical protein
MATFPPDGASEAQRSLQRNIAVHARGRKKVPNKTGGEEIFS